VCTNDISIVSEHKNVWMKVMEACIPPLLKTSVVLEGLPTIIDSR